MNSIIDYLEHWATEQPGKCVFSFLNVTGNCTASYTYLGFSNQTRTLAEYLSKQAGVKYGDRLLLVYPPGLDVVVAFFACVRIGAIPVPVAPPTFMNFGGSLAKLAFVARDCQAKLALTTREFYRSYELLLATHKASSFLKHPTALREFNWVTTNDMRFQGSDRFRNDSNPILFLQYTSGSTSDPKGVIVSHENVIHNATSTIDHVPIGVSWLPQYHDMGLIGYYLFPIVSGGTTYGLSPMDFLKRPILWLQTISRVRATYASSPNFGFEYCLREDKVPSRELEGLNLSSLRVFMNAAEPVRADTYHSFLERFAHYGLRPESHVVAYGLAESTLTATHYGRRTIRVNKQQLLRNTVHIEDPQRPNSNQLRLVSCGRPVEGIHLRIVDSQTCTALGEKQIGEIWLGGKSSCCGYWKRPGLTQEVFRNVLANNPEDRNVYIRTGDLGFLHEEELFVCGRVKDLIIIRGANYYPQDIEIIVESASRKIRKGGVAAFNGAEEGETLVVVAEVRTSSDLPDPVEIAHALRIQYCVTPHTIVFVPSRTIIRTTSGKIARSLTRQRFLEGKLSVIATHICGNQQDSAEEAPGLRQRFRRIIDLYNLTGSEECTFAEIGMDSLALVEFLLDIKQLLREKGAVDLVDEIDVRLLQTLTIAEFFCLLDQFEKMPAQSIATWRQVLKHAQHEYEGHVRECMQSDAVLEPNRFIEITTGHEPLNNVLLTGPTGFFGPFLLSSLLRQTPYTYYVLTRATDPIHGIGRIREALRRSLLWTPSLGEEFERRVHVICGDIARHNLGLRPEQWESLSTRVHAVFHNAALVNYVLNYEALRPHNVDGTRELLRLSFTGRQKEFHYISSTFIFGWTAKGMLMESDRNAEMMSLDFGYSQSKWVAEQLVFAAEKQGLQVRIYRPALISASTRGIWGKDDIAIRVLAFMINHGVAVCTRNQISFLPADIVADNIACVFRQHESVARTLHITTDDYYNMIDITRTITSDYGYQFTYYDIPSFITEMNRRCTSDDPLYPLLDFFNRSYWKIAAMQLKRYNNDQYREARNQFGGARRDPPLRDTVSYLMAYMLRNKLIPDTPTLRDRRQSCAYDR